MSTDIHICQHNRNFNGEFLGKPGEECKAEPTLAHEEIQTPVFFSGGGKTIMDFVMGWTIFYCESHGRQAEKWTGCHLRPILPRDVKHYNDHMKTV